jgi:predicted nucleotidyltransferase
MARVGICIMIPENNKPISAEILLEKLENDPIAWEYYQKLIKESYVLGFMVWGSRATGFGTADSDWDALVYVTEEYYDSINLKGSLLYIYDESISPKRLVVDYSPISDGWFRQQIESPLDIDHFPYAEGIVIYDKTGKLEEWRQRLAKYPEDEHEERLKTKLVQLQVAYYYAMIGEKRRVLDEESFLANRQINLYRGVVSAVSLWFAIKKTWSPPLKFWSQHCRKLGMTDEEFQLFTETFNEPTLENVGKLVKQLEQMIIGQG